MEVTIEKFKNLNLSSVPNNTSNLQLDDQITSESMLTERIKTNKETILAGHITAVMKSTVVIQSAPGSRIVDLGTAVYHQKNASEPVREVGLITDLFGRVSEPMYTMKLLHEEITENSMKMDSPVYYLLQDPRTRFITVECGDEGRFKVIHS